MRKNNFLINTIIWMISIAILVWCQFPIKSISTKIDFPPGKLKVFVPDGSCFNSDQLSVFRQDRQVSLTWEPVIRKGDTSEVKLSFLRSIPKLTTIPELLSNESITSNIFDQYSVEAEARLELIATDVNPAGLSGHVLGEEQYIDFTWVIKPEQSGTNEGTTWFYLKFFPKNGCEPIEQAISAQKINFKVISLLGLDSDIWRIIGIFGLVTGLFLLFFGKYWSSLHIFKNK